MKPFMRLCAFIFFAGLLLGGCLLEGVKIFPSSAEIKKQREKAFDLSGFYRCVEEKPPKKTEKKNKLKKPTQLELTITNQEEKHDIYVRLDRKNPLTITEKELISRVGLRENQFLKQFKNFDLGYSNDNSIWWSSDNVSNDEGLSSEFKLRSDDEIINKDETSLLYYTLEGLVEKKSKKQIKAELTLHAVFSDKKDGENSPRGGSMSLPPYKILCQKEEQSPPEKAQAV